eukprot:6205777-Pleurochrysis_carterae.AAC.1
MAWSQRLFCLWHRSVLPEYWQLPAWLRLRRVWASTVALLSASLSAALRTRRTRAARAPDVTDALPSLRQSAGV